VVLRRRMLLVMLMMLLVLLVMLMRRHFCGDQVNADTEAFLTPVQMGPRWPSFLPQDPKCVTN
jgi:hypothetical protein